MSNGGTKPIRRPSSEQILRSEYPFDEADTPVETNPLLPGEEAIKPTPLPKLQVAALLLVFLPESVTSTLIYPFIVQVSRRCAALERVPKLIHIH